MIQTAVKFPNICQITGLGKSTNKLEEVFWKSFKKVHGNSDSLDFVSEITWQTMLHKQLGDFSVNHETGQQLDTSSLGFALKVSKKKILFARSQQANIVKIQPQCPNFIHR